MAGIWRQAYEEVIGISCQSPFEVVNSDSDLFMKIERLVVVLYDRTSPLSSVNEAREELFCQKNQSVDRIPPTQDALLQHV